MSNFLPLVKKQYDFEGDTISISFKRMTRAQMIQIMPLLPQVEGQEQSFEDNMKLVDANINILVENTSSMVGLNDAEGSALKVEDIADQAYFMKLLSEMASDLMKESMVESKKQPSSSDQLEELSQESAVSSPSSAEV